MRYRAERYEMTAGERNKLLIDLAPLAADNAVNDYAITADGLTFDTPTITGKNVTTFVSGGEAGRNYIATTTTLSNTEVKVGSIILEWKAPGYESRAGWH